jgi:trehalose-phosphatase
MKHTTEEPASNMKAVVIDLGGVLVHTALIHINAWEQVFTEYFPDKGEGPLFSENDYYTYFAGKPRYGRLQIFLNSKNINLPFGNEKDLPGDQTICSLENKKAKLFTRLINEGKLQVYEKAVEKIKYWKAKGLKTAVVSSDEKFKKALNLAEISNLFDVKIDSASSRKMGLKEKPEADLYVEAAKELDLPPESCVLFDDSVAGLQAGSKANYGLVVGVNRTNNRKELSENGADMVIDTFQDFDLFDNAEIDDWFIQSIPPFASEYSKIGKAVYKKIPVVFLDYDGTLTPIVQQPEDAILSKEMQDVLRECAAKFKVAAVSGRDMDDLRSKINIDNLIYAGSHGFRISGPGGLYMEHEKSAELLPKLDRMEEKLNTVFSNTTEGVRVERKRFAIAVHYRNAGAEDIPYIKQKVYETNSGRTGFKVGEGKMILEIKPDINWHKGKAVLWILEKLNLADTSRYIPIYIGDDVTDEDAYEVLKNRGMGIQVGPGAKNTAAHFRLKNVYQVRLLLKELVNSVI